MIVRVKYSHIGSHFRMWLEDEDGRELSNKEVEEKFLQFEIVGVYIKSKYPQPEDFPTGLPTTGLIVSGYTKAFVVCKIDPLSKKDYLIPKSGFHRWFTLD